MNLKSLCMGVAAVVAVSTLGVGCGDASKAESAAQKAEDAANRASAAASRVEAAAQRAQDAADRCENRFKKGLNK
jgi:outer membrane murein-binding lipoprotein Lpp